MVTKVLSLKGKEPSFICDCVQGEISAKALYYSVSQKHKTFLNSKNVKEVLLLYFRRVI